MPYQDCVEILGDWGEYVRHRPREFLRSRSHWDHSGESSWIETVKRRSPQVTDRIACSQGRQTTTQARSR
jgi:hypothetical protein